MISKSYSDRFQTWLKGYTCEYACPLFHGIKSSNHGLTSLELDYMTDRITYFSGRRSPDFTRDECHQLCPLDCSELSDNYTSDVWFNNIDTIHGTWNCNTNQCKLQCTIPGHFEVNPEEIGVHQGSIKCNRETKQWEPISLPQNYGCRECLSDEYFTNNTCHQCNCNMATSTGTACQDGNGQCTCNLHFEGRTCETCPVKYFEKQFGNQLSCNSCQCSIEGSLSQLCETNTGSCDCKPGYSDTKCSTCSDEFYKKDDKCFECNCDVNGKLAEEKGCDDATGKCHCKYGYEGEKCESCISSHFKKDGKCVIKPTHGGWAEWQEVSPCTVACGGGIKYLSRECNSPAPANGGDYCDGLSTDTPSCNLDPCPIHGGWGSFYAVSGCSVNCGGGTMSMRRDCNNPTPAHGGNQCSGSATTINSCNSHGCPKRRSRWSRFKRRFG